MKFFGLNIGKNEQESRSTVNTVSVSATAENFLAYFGLGGMNAFNLPVVTIDSALTVPAVANAVAFLSRTLASVPLNAYRTTKEGPKAVTGKIQAVIGDAPNDEMDSFKFRQYFWQQVFTVGRGMAWIERTPNTVEALWPMDPYRTIITRTGGRTVYRFEDKEYPAADVIDVPFMLRPDGLQHYGPVVLASKAIQLALAMNDYGSNFFAGGGVPPLALTGPLPAGPEAMKRAKADIKLAVDSAKSKNEPIFPIPAGYELKPVGIDPDKSQMIEARRFQIEEIARSWQIPPVFIQDLSRATFSNAEQQDLHLVKHLIGQWAGALEGEMTLKLFGRQNGGRYVEHNLDGLMRGDFKSRIDGFARAIQTAQMTPDEVRQKDNRPPLPNGDTLYIQGATVPLGTVLTQAQPTAPAADKNNPQQDKANAG